MVESSIIKHVYNINKSVKTILYEFYPTKNTHEHSFAMADGAFVNLKMVEFSPEQEDDDTPLISIVVKDGYTSDSKILIEYEYSSDDLNDLDRESCISVAYAPNLSELEYKKIVNYICEIANSGACRKWGNYIKNNILNNMNNIYKTPKTKETKISVGDFTIDPDMLRRSLRQAYAYEAQD